ncbi:hypothetical protein [Shewanella surugensis]|uniref:Uncharacterized protein n=1 Tax=Shewanella surugensis TaxID=212020 RepID=A0ABT0LEH8_9GAMM|nr:hypothetical protein [Shewanella surugensis]MCL1126108.1 hypothetical protein [Shewanella surugensis]
MSEASNDSVSKAEGHSDDKSGVVPPKIGASSGISGAFKPLQGDLSHGNQWAFNFNKAQNEVNLSVSINTPTMLMDLHNQHLEARFTLDDINQLVVWLFQVKTATKQAIAKQSTAKSDPQPGSTSHSSSQLVAAKTSSSAKS